MSKQVRIIVLSSILGVMAICYAVFFLGPSGPDQITVRSRLDRPRRFSPAYPIQAVRFGFDRQYQLTEVLVEQISEPEPESEEPTGEDVFTLGRAEREADESGPLWHLVPTNKRSTPVQGFTYGQRINGMTRADSEDRSRRLRPGVTYRLTVRAGKISGSTEFTPQFFQEPEDVPEQPQAPGAWPYFRGNPEQARRMEQRRLEWERQQRELLEQYQNQPADETAPEQAEPAPEDEPDTQPAA